MHEAGVPGLRRPGPRLGAGCRGPATWPLTLRNLVARRGRHANTARAASTTPSGSWCRKPGSRARRTWRGLVIAQRDGTPIMLRDVAVGRTGRRVPWRSSARTRSRRSSSAADSVGRERRRRRRPGAGPPSPRWNGPPGVEIGIGGQAQMMAENTRDAWAWSSLFAALLRLRRARRPVRVLRPAVPDHGPRPADAHRHGRGSAPHRAFRRRHGAHRRRHPGRERGQPRRRPGPVHQRGSAPQGRPLREAIVEASTVRMRPILMTLDDQRLRAPAAGPEHRRGRRHARAYGGGGHRRTRVQRLHDTARSCPAPICSCRRPGRTARTVSEQRRAGTGHKTASRRLEKAYP
ncbi:MAG: hypothetical protein MZV63_65685 [Marinilabiliales bacterium]|nr:hypothetical protein [Marinilabiliales bacterium]